MVQELVGLGPCGRGWDGGGGGFDRLNVPLGRLNVVRMFPIIPAYRALRKERNGATVGPQSISNIVVSTTRPGCGTVWRSMAAPMDET